jgi:transposase
MDKNKIYFSIEQKHAIIKEYLNGNETKVEIWKRYTGQSKEHGGLVRWMRALGYVDVNENRKRLVTLYSNPINISLKEGNSNIDEINDPEELKKRIRSLQKELQDSKLREEGYQLMIDIAEKDLKIPIRKKSNTK